MTVKWGEAQWTRALKQSKRKYFPDFKREVPCGFCVEMNKVTKENWSQTALDFGCDPKCPAYRACIRLLTAAEYSPTLFDRNTAEERVGQAWLRRVGPRHGVPMPAKKKQ